MFWTRVNMPIASPVRKINSGDMSNDTNQGKLCYTNATNKNPKSQWPNKDFTSHSYTSDVGWGTLQDRLLSLSLHLPLKKQLACCRWSRPCAQAGPLDPKFLQVSSGVFKNSLNKHLSSKSLSCCSAIVLYYL